MKCHIHLHSSLDGRVDAAVDGKERQVLDPFESVAYFLVAEALAGVDQDDAQALLARSSSPAAAVDIALKFKEMMVALLPYSLHSMSTKARLSVISLPLMSWEPGSGSHAGRC